MSYKLLTPLLLFAVVGCSPADTVQDAFDDYESRLRRVMELPSAAAPQPPEPALFPAKRDQLKPLPDAEIDLGELWDLRQCPLSHVISERNSVLGKVQPPALRFNYEILFDQALHECLIQHKDDPEKLALLEQIQQMKASHLPLQLHNLLYESEELRGMFAPVNKEITLEDRAKVQSARALLRHLVSIKEQVVQGEPLSEQDGERLMELLEQNRNNQVIGQLNYQMQQYKFYLDHVANLLDSELDGLRCPNGRPTEQVNILKNVLLNVYGERLLPPISETYRDYQQVQPMLAELYYDESHPLLRQFDGDGLLDEVKQALLRHSRSWQTLFDRCGGQLGT